MKPARFFVSASGLGVTLTFKFTFTLVFTFALALAWVGPVFSQAEARVKAEAKGPDGAKRDYQKERFAFAAREDFDPQALMLMEREMHEKSMKLLEAGQVVQEVKMYQELLKTYPYCLDAHKYLAKRFEIISGAEGSPEDKAYFQKKAAAHQAAYRGILDSILDSIMDGHDGLTEQSAYPVITEAEKHAVMRELEVFGLGGTPSPDGALEILQVKTESRFERPLYFDVTRLRDAKGTKEKAEKKGK